MYTYSQVKQASPLTRFAPVERWVRRRVLRPEDPHEGSGSRRRYTLGDLRSLLIVEAIYDSGSMGKQTGGRGGDSTGQWVKMVEPAFDLVHSLRSTPLPSWIVIIGRSGALGAESADEAAAMILAATSRGSSCISIDCRTIDATIDARLAAPVLPDRSRWELAAEAIR